MTMIKPATGWFKIVEIPTYKLDEVMGGNDENTDKSSARVSQLFNNTCLSRYPCPRKVMFENGSEFKRDFTLLLKYFGIKSVVMTIKNFQANAPVEQLHQVISNVLVTKYLDNKVFDHIDTWGETIASIAYTIRDSYHRTIMATPGQDLFGRDMIFNLVSVV